MEPVVSRRALVTAAAAPLAVGAVEVAGATSAGAATSTASTATDVAIVSLAVAPGMSAAAATLWLTAQGRWGTLASNSLVWIEDAKALYRADTTRRILVANEVVARTTGSLAFLVTQYDPSRARDGVADQPQFARFAAAPGGKVTLWDADGWTTWTGVDLLAAVPIVRLAVAPGVDRAGFESGLAAGDRWSTVAPEDHVWLEQDRRLYRCDPGRRRLLATETQPRNGTVAFVAAFLGGSLEPEALAPGFVGFAPTDPADPTSAPSLRQGDAWRSWSPSGGAGTGTGPWVDVADHLAGSEDSTAAFEAALAALPAGGGTVVFGGTHELRRSIRLRSRTRLLGNGPGAVLTKAPTTTVALAADAVPESRTLRLERVDGLRPGDEVTIRDDVRFEWEGSHAVIAAVDAGTGSVTVDRDLSHAYRVDDRARLSTVFPLVTVADPADAEFLHIADMTLDQRAVEGVDPDDDFTVSALHLERGRHCTVEDVVILNAATDGYSDQGRHPDFAEDEGPGFPGANQLRGCRIIGAGRHGVHLGTRVAGSAVTGCVVEGCRGMAVYLCAGVHDVRISGNTVLDCGQGIAGGDRRDRRNVITGNTMVGGPRSTGHAVQVGPGSVITGNSLCGWPTGIELVELGAPAGEGRGAVISGNRIEVPAGSGEACVKLGAGSHGAQVVDNELFAAGQNEARAVYVERSDWVLLRGNRVHGLQEGVVVVGPLVGLTVDDHTDVPHPTLAPTQAPDRFRFLCLEGGDAISDVHLDLRRVETQLHGGFDPVRLDETARGWAMVRPVLDGWGDNGDTDPATGGPWSQVEGRRHDGVRVLWTQDGERRVSERVRPLGGEAAWIRLA